MEQSFPYLIPFHPLPEKLFLGVRRLSRRPARWSCDCSGQRKSLVEIREPSSFGTVKFPMCKKHFGAKPALSLASQETVNTPMGFAERG